MPSTPCPACGGTSFEMEGPQHPRCTKCGAHLVYRIAWVPYVITWAVVGAAVGLVLNVVLGAVGAEWSSTARMLLIGALTGALATVAGRRFRRLARA